MLKRNKKLKPTKQRPEKKMKRKLKLKAEEKVVAEKEKELAEVARVAVELVEKETKEAVDKVVEEERQRKNAENRDGDTHPMDLDIPGMSIVGTEAETTSSGLGLGPWEPFRPTEVLDLRSFTYDSKTGRIVQERVKKVPVTEGAPISVVTQVPVIGDVREDPVATTKVVLHLWMQP
jgi:hypothetical protein